MIARREFIIALGVAALAAPVTALAQQKERVRRIGFFYTGSRQSAIDTGRYGGFIDGMRDLGYVQGKDYVLEERFDSGGDPDRMAAQAQELVRAAPDVIVSLSNTARVLRRFTPSIPIVVAIGYDPVRIGLAASLARPGGNVTGLSSMGDELFPKHLELLKVAVPSLSRVAVLFHPESADHPPIFAVIRALAGKLGVRVQRVDVSEPSDFEPAFSAMARERAQALIVLGDAMYVQHFRRIAELAMRNRIPSVFSGREYPEVGGFMSYGPNFADTYRRAATFVDKILKGAKPGELPFEQPTRFELVVNAKTAKIVGITIPHAILVRADEVIE